MGDILVPILGTFSAGPFTDPVADARSRVLEPALHALVAARLDDVARAHGVRVLYACLTGSRAFGWPAPDSDMDVRFIFAHPAIRYLTLGEAPPDVITHGPGRTCAAAETGDSHTELEGSDLEGWDLEGWDVRKALRLLKRSNITLHEWLASPAIVTDAAGFGDDARALLARGAARATVARQYLGLAEAVRQTSATGAADISAKHAAHLLCSVLSLRWLVATGHLPPAGLMQLVAAPGVPDEIGDMAREIAAARRQTRAARLPADERTARMLAWIDREMATLGEAARLLPERGADIATDAERLFHAAIGWA